MPRQGAIRRVISSGSVPSCGGRLPFSRRVASPCTSDHAAAPAASCPAPGWRCRKRAPRRRSFLADLWVVRAIQLGPVVTSKWVRWLTANRTWATPTSRRPRPASPRVPVPGAAAKPPAGRPHPPAPGANARGYCAGNGPAGGSMNIPRPQRRTGFPRTHKPPARAGRDPGSGDGSLSVLRMRARL